MAIVSFCATKYRPLPDGKYKACLEEIRDNEQGAFGQDIFVFVFKILEGDFKDCQCNYLINKEKNGEYGIKNKLANTIKALAGECNLFANCELNELLGRECVIYIKLTEGKRFSNRIYRIEAIDG